MDHRPVERKNSDSPPPPPSSSTNGFQEQHHHEERRLISGLNSAVMAADLAGAATAGIMSEEYQKVLKLRQQHFDEQFLALQHQRRLQEHFRRFFQNQQEQQQSVVKNHHLRQLEEQRQHSDLVNQVVNKDKSLESANASPSVKRHLHSFVIGRRKNKPYEGYPNNGANRLRWAPSLDSRNGVHDLSAPYPHLFDKRNSFPLRKTASEPNLKVKSSRFRKGHDRRCSPLLPRHSADNRADLADRIKRKINNDQAAADNSASSSAPNSGPSSPLSSNSNINHSSTSKSGTSARGIGLLAAGSSEIEFPSYPVPYAFGLGPREIYASPSLPNISLELSQKNSDPNAMITATPAGMMMYPDSELQRLVLSRTSSLPSPFMQQLYKPVGAVSEMDIALRNYLLQQQLGATAAGLPGAEKDPPGPIRHAAQARPHKTLSRTHSAPTTTAQLQQHILQRKRLMMQQQQHKHAPHLISGMAAEAQYRPLATHREASEQAESASSSSSSKQRKQKLAASPPPTHPSAISSATVAALHSHLNKHSNKGLNQFPKQSDSKTSPPTARHTLMDHFQTTPEKSSRSVIVGPQQSLSEDDQDVVVKHERPDASDEMPSSYPPQIGHRQLAAMAVQDKVHDLVPSKPSPLQARRSLLEGEMGSHRPITRTQSSPAVSFSQNHKHKEYRYTTGLAYDPIMLRHGCACGDAHAEHAGRLKEVWARLNNVGLVDTCEMIDSRKATMEELQLAHTQEHTIRYGATPLARQQSALPDKFIVLPCGGVGVNNGIDIDTVWNEQDTINAARMAVGLTVDLALSVAAQELQNGFAIVRPPGHHAEKNLAMAFCYFNSVAVAARQLQRTYPDKIRRILIVDWDVHHCNGTQDIFYDDDSVLVISIHRYDEANFFPGTGAPDETGAGPGVGFNVNIGFSGGLEPPISDADYLAAFRSVVMPIAEEFNPDFVFVSAGFSAADGHPSELGGYKVTPQCFSHLTRMLSQLADGKIVMALEGGFELTPLCDCVEICIRTLLSEDTKDGMIGKLSESSLESAPCENAVRSINRISRFQERYWSRLKRMSAYINVSHAVYLGQEQEDRTWVALASLSVEHPKQMESKAKLQEVLACSKGSKIEAPSQDVQDSDVDPGESKLTIVTDDMPTQNREEAMSDESSPLDVVGLSPSSFESPSPSPKNLTAFVTQEATRNSPLVRQDRTEREDVNDEPMEQEQFPGRDET